MADWPEADQVKRRLGITSSDSGVDEDVALALDAAIEQVINDTGWDADLDSGTLDITASLSQAALLLAVACFKATDAPHGVAAIFDMGGLYVARQNPHYQRLLVGNRVRFGISGDPG
jgi:hypothetical protein